MSWRDDDEKAYRTSEGMVGRSFRRGVRKGLKAVSLGLLSEDPVSGSFRSLAGDAAKEAAEAYRRSHEDD